MYQNVKTIRYVLKSRGALNAVSVRKEFAGALILVDGGVGCLHPWPEFGDEGVEEQLRILQNGGSTKVIDRALRMAQVDGEARRAGVNLFTGLDVPRSHYSWDSHGDFAVQMQRVVEEGWPAVKVKGTIDLVAVTDWLEKFALEGGGIKARIDFNSCLKESDLRDWWSRLPESFKQAVDFLEDPFPYAEDGWEQVRQDLGLRLALDKQLRGAKRGFDVAVLKPGRRDWRAIVAELPEDVSIVLTSAMDHAVGQSYAAWEAACAWSELGSRVSWCGLCTEHLFESDELGFFDRISSKGGWLKVDRDGTGLGFDDLLRDHWR